MKIIGTGSSLPKKIVTNEALSELVDTSDEWIRTRTGIRERHIATEETTTSLAAEAAENALKSAGVAPEELDLIVAATVTSDRIIPMLSCEVQARLGAKKAVAFDIGAACSGFLFALGTANAYLNTGKYQKALVLGAETLSKIIDWTDRSTCVLFGDGAGAVVVTSEEDSLLGMVQGSDGASGMALNCVNRMTDNPFHKAESTTFSYVHMDGPAVYKFAVRTVPKAIQEALAEAGIVADEVDHYILHQANLRILEAVSARLKQPMEKFFTNLERCGNISAASVPILLDEVVRAGKIQKGDIVVLAGFGAGLTWGACVLRW